ncbi:MAG: sulfatase-like hydrolase/transferase [Acidobacteria bacterium]|nr:sulfatase-like hydrolase/transferase [Acidobacteriota bacterium]
MTGRRLAAWLGAAAIVTAALLVWWRHQAAGTVRADGPIVLISIDTLRADRLPAYGYTRIRTPNIDRLAADGALFERAYSQSPQTLPAHTSILSGRLPFAHGVRDNIGFSVAKDERMLQHALHETGFETGGFVSAYVLRRQTGIGAGFDVYDDRLPPASADKPLGQVQRSGGDTVAAAIRWIDGRASPKFFLFVHIYEPHRPYSPPQRFAAADPYDGEIEYSDAIVGRLLDDLRAKRLYDRATIVLVSDHGEGLGDHGEDEHGIFLYRETIQVPLIVKLPASRGAGRRLSTPVQQIDLAPTLLDLGSAGAAGSQPRDALPGRSLVPILDGTGAIAETSLYAESLSPRYHFGWSELYALTDGRYRLIRAPRDELYDIAQDPAERHSIAGDRPQVVSAMRRALDGLIGAAAVGRPSAVSDEDRRRLAALGYVGTQTGAPLLLPADRLPDPKDKVAVLQKYRRATDLAGARRFADASALYRELLREDPELTDVWLQLAEVYGRRGLVVDAVAAYREVLKRSPKDPAGLTGAAAGLLRLGRLDEARAHAELALDVAPAGAHELLARIAIERGDPAEARRHAKLAQAADPGLPMTAFAEGLLLHREGRFAAALGQLMAAKEALADRTVQMPDVHYYIGDSLARLERYDEAERFFLAELDLLSGHVRARAGLAMLYKAQRRDADAARAIADLIRHAPTPEGYDVAAQLWTMFGEPARAAEVRAEAGRLPR